MKLKLLEKVPKMSTYLLKVVAISTIVNSISSEKLKIRWHSVFTVTLDCGDEETRRGAIVGPSIGLLIHIVIYLADKTYLHDSSPQKKN